MATCQNRLLEGHRVLIVEDNDVLADDVAYAVRMAGGEVDGPCKDLEFAFAALQGRSCDIAVLDIRLGGDITVFPLAEVLLRQSIGFVFTTGYQKNFIPDHVRRVPIWHKPFSAVYLVAGLSMMLDLSTHTPSIRHSAC